LAPLLERDWGVVVTIADYDSSVSAGQYLGQCSGTIDEVLDVSLVDQPTFLAECVGLRAKRVRPILMATRNLTRDDSTYW
jgi:Tfp pilus assembly protein PilP